MNERLVLLVGGADTGRAPMAAALLRRLLMRHGLEWTVASAGVLGHDEALAEPEARSAMLALGLDLSAHRARSLSDELAASAQVLIAIDSGIARVLQARYPTLALTTIGQLAGRARDIPDPFRMQVGAWIQYAGELEALLTAGLPSLRAMLAGDRQAPPPASPQHAQPDRRSAVERAHGLLGLLVDLPAVVDWTAARAQIECDFSTLAQPLAPGDLARPYVALLRSLLNAVPNTPSADQAKLLRTAIKRLDQPIGAAELEAITQDLERLTG